MRGLGVMDVKGGARITITDNDGVKKRVKSPFYMRWHSMFDRCYSEAYLSRNPSYVGCEVSPEWYLFSTFKEWMEKQNYEGMCLDKDILVIGNKVYSPDTCLFVPPNINLLVTDCTARRGDSPLGVYYNEKRGKYIAACSNQHGQQVKLGQFNDADKAHEAWRQFKLNIVHSMKNDLDEIDIRLYDSLIKRYS